MTSDRAVVTRACGVVAFTFAMVAQAVPAAALNNVPFSGKFFTENVEYWEAAPGDVKQFVVGYTNLGQKSWVKGSPGNEARLGTRDPLDNTADSRGGWSMSWTSPTRIAIQDDAVVAPGAVGYFIYSAKVPAGAPAGRHPFKARPLIEGVTWLEDYGYYQGFNVASSSGTGLIYAQGTMMMKDGAPIQLFGVNDTMAFVYTYWRDYGRNYNFPTFDGRIPNVASAIDFWKAYFRHFLHYQQVGTPRPNLLRLTVGWDFGSEDSYTAWKSDPAAYFAVFDAMVTSAKAAGVYLVPMLMSSPNDRSFIWQYFDTSSSRYAHLVEFERGLMSKYAAEPTIAMWDVFNEADVGTRSWWTAHGNFAGFKAWEQKLVNDVRSATSQLITVGHAMTSADYNFPNDGFGFDQKWYNAFADIQGVDVPHIHVYGTAEDQYLIDWMKGWADSLGRPFFVGELGYNAYPSPVGAVYPIGHWPWETDRWLAAKLGPVAEMTWLDNGKGAYADYPYTGTLPGYPSNTFDFSLSLSPTSGTVNQGSSVAATATAASVSGTAQSVTFSATGLPSGASASFSPTGCNPTCISTLTVSTSSTTPNGTHAITVAATGGGLTRTGTYALTVSSPCPSSPPSYPSGAWDRVWCDASFSSKLADIPDQAGEKFDDDWARGTVAGIRADDLAFRSGRTIGIAAAGDYTFSVGADDGVRVWIDGTLVLDKWLIRAYTVDTFVRTLGAGSHQVRVDYYENSGDARVSFTYSP